MKPLGLEGIPVREPSLPLCAPVYLVFLPTRVHRWATLLPPSVHCWISLLPHHCPLLGITAAPVGPRLDITAAPLLSTVLGVTAALLLSTAGRHCWPHYCLLPFPQLDTEGWWSVTPEVLAKHQSSQCRRYSLGFVALDAMAGCGGNAIQLTHHFSLAYAVEISRRRANMAAHNAGVYGVGSRMEVRGKDCLLVCAPCSVALHDAHASDTLQHF